MSPSKRKRPAAGKGSSQGAAPASGAPGPLQRLGLLIFGLAFILLFAGFAIAQGIGSPSIPSGDVALVEGVPASVGHVSEAEYKRSLLQAAAQAGLKSTPKPGEKQYEELKKTALGSLFDTIWIQGQAEEMGITATPKQIATELAQIKKQNFKTAAAYQRISQDLAFHPKRRQQPGEAANCSSTQIQQQIGKEAPTPSSSQTQQYYEAAAGTQFTTPASREIRLILNKDKAKAEAAKALLENDHSATSWQKVAKKYSTETTSKNSGGLQAGVTEERFQEPLNSAIFSATTGQLEGPIKNSLGYYVFVVEKTTPEKVQPLSSK